MAEPNLNLSNLDPNSFRAAAREWLESNCPPSMRTPSRDDEVVWGGTKGTFKSPEAKIWLEPRIGLAQNHGLTPTRLATVIRLVEEHRDEIRAAWKAHFGR